MPFRSTSTSTRTTRHSRTLARRRSRRLRLAGLGAFAVAAGLACTGVVVSATTGTPVIGTSALADSIGAGTPSGTPTIDAGAGVTITRLGDDRISVHAGSAVPRNTANTVAAIALASGHDVKAKAQSVATKTHATVSTTTLSRSTTTLSSRLAKLSDYRSADPDIVMARVEATQDAADAVSTATAATEKAAQAEAAAKAKAATAAKAKAAEAKADAIRQAAANTPDGAKATAKALMASQYGWGDDQYGCLVSLWTKESGWNYQAYNASGATGIPQALPGSKMASVSSDWASNATTQVIWGLGYISGSYGTPCAAWAHSVANNWY